MTQCERLAKHLETKGSINPLQAWQALGIYRLGARVFDLKQDGMKIKTRKVNVDNRFGEKCRVAEYYLDGNNGY